MYVCEYLLYIVFNLQKKKDLSIFHQHFQIEALTDDVSLHYSAYSSMDLLCDTLEVEPIVPGLELKDLLRLRAASHRYNALSLHPDFSARYWQHAGVVQPSLCFT